MSFILTTKPQVVLLSVITLLIDFSLHHVKEHWGQLIYAVYNSTSFGHVEDYKKWNNIDQSNHCVNNQPVDVPALTHLATSFTVIRRFDICF
jgi:hypothetical protein